MRPFMNHDNKYQAWNRVYNVIFIVSLLIAFLCVMIVSMSHGYRGFEENFLYKYYFIEKYNRLKLKVGDRVFPLVLVGNDGWMDYTNGNNLDDFQNSISLSPEKLKEIGDAVASCHQYAHTEGFTFLLVVAPNKASIYPDKLPEQIQQLSNESRLDQINAYLRANGIPEALDLRPALLEARKQREVYYKTDTHWNGYGAYAAYREIINNLSLSHPSLSPYPEKFFHIHEERTKKPMDLAATIQANFILEQRIVPAQRNDKYVHALDFPDRKYGISWIPDSDLPSLLMFHDSFGDSLYHFLLYNFSEAYYHYLDAAPLFLDRNSIDQFDTDIVIVEIVERDIQNIPVDLQGCMSR